MEALLDSFEACWSPFDGTLILETPNVFDAVVVCIRGVLHMVAFPAYLTLEPLNGFLEFVGWARFLDAELKSKSEESWCSLGHGFERHTVVVAGSVGGLGVVGGGGHLEIVVLQVLPCR